MAKDPSGAVAVATFFPVCVFEAVTVTPGSGVLADLIVPRTMKGTATTGVGGAGAADGAADTVPVSSAACVAGAPVCD